MDLLRKFKFTNLPWEIQSQYTTLSLQIKLFIVTEWNAPRMRNVSTIATPGVKSARALNAYIFSVIKYNVRCISYVSELWFTTYSSLYILIRFLIIFIKERFLKLNHAINHRVCRHFITANTHVYLMSIIQWFDEKSTLDI